MYRLIMSVITITLIFECIGGALLYLRFLAEMDSPPCDMECGIPFGYRILQRRIQLVPR